MCAKVKAGSAVGRAPWLCSSRLNSGVMSVMIADIEKRYRCEVFCKQWCHSDEACILMSPNIECH